MKKLLRFTASWCQPCKALAKNLEVVNTNLPIEVIDIDVHSELAVDFGIRSVPTLVMMEDNIEIKRIVGAKSSKELENWLNG